MSISSYSWEAQFRHHGGAPDSTTVVHGGQINSNSKLIRRRSRASRKAPTTQLNASTANFRDLVQQFTGFQAAAAGVPLGSHKGPVNLRFGQTGDDIRNNHPSVMLPFSDGRHFQLHRQPPTDYRFPTPPSSRSGDSGFCLPAAELTEIQNLIEEDLNYEVHDLAMEFYCCPEQIRFS